MIQFFKAPRSKYIYPGNPKLYDAVYFAEDTGELLVNGVNYGADLIKIKDVSQLESSLIFTFADGSTKTIDLIEVVDNLTSTDTTKALAASLGKILADKIEELKTSLSSVYNYKGSVADFNSLPSNASIGDTYNVIASNGNIPAGTNYAWNGTDWDALGGTVDLSAYPTTELVNQLIETKTDLLKVDELKTDVDTIKDKLIVIEGEGEGSIKNALLTAKTYTDDLLVNYIPKVEGSSLITTEKLLLIDTNTSEIADLKTDVEANTTLLTLLNSDVNTEGSILNIINTQITNALNWQVIN